MIDCLLLNIQQHIFIVYSGQYFSGHTKGIKTLNQPMCCTFTDE